MLRPLLRCISVAAIAAGMLLADFSYEQTSKITGGMVASMMKVAGAFSKQAREPIRDTVAVKGDRMWHGNDMRGQIVDLGKETITTIDFQKKTWSVMTFAEMAQALDDMSKKMKQNQNAEVRFKVSANATGQTRQIAGVEAKEMLLKMEMEGTDQQSGQAGGMVITTNIWMAPKAAGYDEVREFHRRMAEKLNWTPGASMVGMGQPDVAKGMAEVYKEAAKLDGMPVFQETKMTGQGQPTSPPASQPDGQAQAQPAPSASSAIGGALAGRFGLGRKKQDNSGQSAPAGTSGAPASAPGSLLEMTTEMSNFSATPVDSSRFEVPAGFKQKESDLRRMR
jgi:hypothetical protein